MLYVEAPAGVGFSYSDDQIYDTDDDKVRYTDTQDQYSSLITYRPREGWAFLIVIMTNVTLMMIR